LLLVVFYMRWRYLSRTFTLCYLIVILGVPARMYSNVTISLHSFDVTIPIHSPRTFTKRLDR
jgi:hypothetical protein